VRTKWGQRQIDRSIQAAEAAREVLDFRDGASRLQEGSNARFYGFSILDLLTSCGTLVNLTCYALILFT